MPFNNPALPKGSLVLVTGANGFIATNVIDLLLKNGYKFRGTVRTARPWLDELFTQEYGQAFESVMLPSFENCKRLDAILEGVSGVIHVASDMTFDNDPQAVIPWVVKAIRNVLDAAQRQPSVKRVVHVSSTGAAYMRVPGWESIQVDENTYETSVRLAWDDQIPEPLRRLAVYAASKTEAEKEALKWMQQHQPHFVLNTILPSNTIGRVLHKHNLSSMVIPKLLLDGDEVAYTMMPEQWAVDVEDVARLACICLLDQSVKSERVFAAAERLGPVDLAHKLQEIRLEDTRIPRPPDIELPRAEILPRARAEALLRDIGRDGFTAVREALARGIESLEHLRILCVT